MKNYQVTLFEYMDVKKRIEILRERLQRLNAQITAVTSKAQEQTSGTGYVEDKIAMYLVRKEETLLELHSLYDESVLLQSHLNHIDNMLKDYNTRNLHDIEEEIYVLKYVKGLKPRDIARRIPCHISTVYRYLERTNTKG